jgi:hypothetical protein
MFQQLGRRGSLERVLLETMCQKIANFNRPLAHLELLRDYSL